MYFTAKLQKALRWRDDVEDGEMIESHNYRKEYMGFNKISQKELNAICEAANCYYSLMGSSLRIGNSMGELKPGKVH